jgi:peptide subunit release factor 1 (eRF1)
MAGLSRGLKTSAGSYFAETDRLPEEVKKRIIDAFPASMEPTELLRALRAVVDLHYDETELVDSKLGMDRVLHLGVAMREYLSAFN